MKNTAFIIMGILWIILFSNNFAAFAGPTNVNLREVKERLITLRNWQLMEEFNLSPQKAQRVFNILKGFDDKRIRLIQKRRKIINKLRHAVENGSISNNELNRLMNELNKINIAIARLPDEERRALSGVFTPQEQARYILFSQRFARNIRQAMRRSKPVRRAY